MLSVFPCANHNLDANLSCKIAWATLTIGLVPPLFKITLSASYLIESKSFHLRICTLFTFFFCLMQ
jgi:hypothetical protein